MHRARPPTDAVQAGKRELCFERPDQVRSREDDAAAAAGRQPDRAGAVTTGRGGLEVDRNERGHRRDARRRSPTGWKRNTGLGEIAEPVRRGRRRLAQSRRPLDGCCVGCPCLATPPNGQRTSRRVGGTPLVDVDISRLCFLVGLHDAGKANHGFQARLRRERPDAGHIAPLWGSSARGCTFIERIACCISKFARLCRPPRWQAWFGGPDTERYLWGVILAHHGSLPERTSAIPPDPRLWRQRGGYDPIAALQALADAMEKVFPDAFAPENRGPLPASTRFQHAFAGFVTLADWLGSDETVFGSRVAARRPASSEWRGRGNGQRT